MHDKDSMSRTNECRVNIIVGICEYHNTTPPYKDHVTFLAIYEETKVRHDAPTRQLSHNIRPVKTRGKQKDQIVKNIHLEIIW